MHWLSRSVFVLIWLGLAQTQAQTDIVTDRPDLTESPISVPYRSVQVEAGVVQTWETSDQIEAGALVRLGVGRGWEARVEIPTYSRTAQASGVASPTLGAKLEVGSVSGWDIAAIAQTSIPTRGEFGDTWTQPSAILTAGRDLPRDFSLGTQGELAYDPESQTASGGGTVVVGRSVAGPLSTFLELAAAVEDFALSSLLVHHGYTLLLTPTLQLDAHIGIGLEGSAAPDALIGLGVSVRR